jgi:DNA-binding protein HU-beta
MTKADIVNAISRSTGIDRASVLATVEGFMDEVMSSMSAGENVYLRGFGSFVVKKRAAKAARNIKKETTLMVPERHVPTFKASRFFANNVKEKMAKK